MRHVSLFSILLVMVIVPGAFAQSSGSSATMTYDDQVNLIAPTASGETGLFTTVTGTQLHKGDWDFGLYLNGYNEFSAPARAFVPPTRRSYQDQSYLLETVNVSIGYGLLDRWEVSASLPFSRISGQGGDRAGFINGWLYQGKFSDSGVADLHLATKVGLLAPGSRSALAFRAFADLPTGSDNSGIATGNGNFGLGLHWTSGQGTLAGTYVINGRRDSSHSNVTVNGFTNSRVDLPNEFRVDAGLNHPLGWWHTTNWISEVNGVFYNGGDARPKSPIFLVTGLRHWFGDSGWAANAGIRWNAAKFTHEHKECAFTELQDCGLTALVGLTYSPFHIAAVVPPPPPPPAPVPPPPPAPAPAPVPPPEQPPVVPQHQPTELRTDEIHFEPGSARLTNIAKAILDDVALRMKQEPTSTALVIGYTDDRETTGTDLDRRRAEAVRDYLVSRHGIDAQRITVEGHDGREPVADNGTAEGRLRNRRVVIRLVIP